jgi:hypothetical protein
MDQNKYLIQFILALALVGCSDNGVVTADGGSDVAEGDVGQDVDRDTPPSPDAASDVPVDVFDAARPLDTGRPWTSEWQHEPSVQVFDSTPCEPWEPVTSPLPRGLPADSTPRVLWTYQPSLDPMYDGPNARFIERVQAPVVSPDGTIWVRGPGYDQVTQLNRDGTMRGWHVAGGAFDEDEKDTQRLGQISVAPDGHLIAVIYSAPEQEGYVINIDPDSGEVLNPISTGTLFKLDVHSRLASSPDGMVYAISQNRVYGLCQGSRLMWTLTNEHAPGEEEFFQSGYFGQSYVLHDGGLQLSGVFARTYLVTQGGEVTANLLFDDVDRDFRRLIYAQTRTSLMMTRSDPSASSEDLISIGVRVGGDWRIASGLSHPLTMSPTGNVYLSQGIGSYESWNPVDGGRMPLPNDLIFTEDDVWDEEGGWISFATRDGVSALYALDAAGETRWALDPTPGPDDRALAIGGEHRILDEQGVYYRAVFVAGAQVQLVAIQTDVLPAPMTMCLDYWGCNPHRDRYLRP